MRLRDSESATTLVITDHNGKQMQASAVQHKDPHYLHANRISLIGPQDKHFEILGLDTDGDISWNEHVRPDWHLSDDPTYNYSQSGKGWLQSSGMTHGASIADDSVQPYADIQIISTRTCLRSQHIFELRAEYIFLQRPSDWHVRTRRKAWRAHARTEGAWIAVKSLGVSFRLLRIIHYRDDERIGQEREMIELPGIEFKPTISGMDDEEFFQCTDRLWSLLRTLLVFRFRQAVHTLIETKIRPGLRETIWHNIKLEPRERNLPHIDPPFFAPLEAYLRTGIKALLNMEKNCELLYAAAYGYGSSFNSGVMETRLTLCIEGIERVVEAFERSRGLTRETVNRRRWRKLGSLARRAAVPAGETPSERQAIRRALSRVPTLDLIERINRMVRAQRRNERELAQTLLDGADAMITARNHIVHGRIVQDLAALQAETIRARALFERLWLGLLNCGRLQTSGWPAFHLSGFYAEASPDHT